MQRNKINNDEKIFNDYVELGADLKTLCILSMATYFEISNKFEKNNRLSKKAKTINNKLEELRSDLEDTMPYKKMKQICREKNVNPLDIFYSYDSKNETNIYQMETIYKQYFKERIKRDE